MVTAGQTLLVVYSVFFLGQIGPWDHDATLTEGLDSPARIAITSDQVLVADTFGNRVVRYDLNGAYLGSWPEPAGPVAVQAHPDGRIFVSRRDDGQVAVYDADFAFLRLLGDGVITFEKATDLATDSVTGRVYVVDSGADRVAAFDADEQLVLLFGARGSRTGEFKYPSAIAIDEANQRVLVADQDNFRVQVFTPSGVFLLSFGYRIKYLPGGSSEGWFVRTVGLAVDDDGLTYMADSSMSRIRAFTPTGAELGVVADYGFGPGELRTPAGIAFDGEGRLFVANSGAGSVEIFSQSRDKGSSGRGVVYEGTNAWHLERVVSGIVDPVWSESSILPWLPQGLAAGTSEWEPPHMLDDVICGRCHDIDGQPGGHLGLAEGQTNLCFSCHTVAGQALRQPFRWMNIADPYGTNPLVPDGRGHSHAWGVPAVNSEADSIGPTPGGAMALHLDGGNIKCATCHNQHNSQAGTPFLRISNQGDAMCKQCHTPRNEGLGELGTHPVGFAYPEGVGEFPPVDELTPLIVPYGLVQCTSCHAPHYADSGGTNEGLGDGMLLRTTNDEALCVKCHQEHVVHTPASEWQPTCIECHDIHDPASENLSLVARIVYNQTLQEDKSVVFLARQGPHSFSDGSPSVNDGICQVCHTATSYHRHDGTGAPHHGGSNCTNCHPHSTGFMPAGGSCIECHGVAQDNGDGVPPGGRRAIVGEFPVDDPHAHYGTEFDDNACLICHDLATHMNGNVELLDADDGSIYSFVFPTELAASPDLSDFCMSCHDDDGATRLPDPLDPFGNGNTAPDAATRFAGTLQWNEWYGDFCFGEQGTLRAVNSHHDISDADQAFSGAKIECLDCHGAHNAAASQPLADPFDTSAPWTGSDNAFCLACHQGGAGPLDPGFPENVVGPDIPLRGIDSCGYVEEPWYVDYTWTHSAHGPDSKRGWTGYSGAPEYELACLDCHDPHGSYTETNTAGNPYSIRDFVDGTAYVDDGSRRFDLWTGPPWETFGITRAVAITIDGLEVSWGDENGLCSVCHSQWLVAEESHDFCVGCQSCHAHGALWGEFDWEDSDDGTPCGP